MRRVGATRHRVAPTSGGPLLRDRVADLRLEWVLARRARVAAGARHDLEARVERDHGRRELLKDADIALDLGRAVRDLGLQRLIAQFR